MPLLLFWQAATTTASTLFTLVYHHVVAVRALPLPRTLRIFRVSSRYHLYPLSDVSLLAAQNADTNAVPHRATKHQQRLSDEMLYLDDGVYNKNAFGLLAHPTGMGL